MSTDTLTQDILDARRNLPRFIPDDLLIITNTNAAHDLAEHLTTRGWQQQTTITELSEVQALSEGTVLRGFGLFPPVYHASDAPHEIRTWYTAGSEYPVYDQGVELPARVLYTPEEQ